MLILEEYSACAKCSFCFSMSQNIYLAHYVTKSILRILDETFGCNLGKISWELQQRKQHYCRRFTPQFYHESWKRFEGTIGYISTYKAERKTRLNWTFYNCIQQIRAFREAHLNRATDTELKGLAKYLKEIGDLKNFNDLNHDKWEKYRPGKTKKDSWC